MVDTAVEEVSSLRGQVETLRTEVTNLQEMLDKSSKIIQGVLEEGDMKTACAAFRGVRDHDNLADQTIPPSYNDILYPYPSFAYEWTAFWFQRHERGLNAPDFIVNHKQLGFPGVFDKALDLVRDRIEILQWDIEVNGIVKPVYYLEGRVYWVDEDYTMLNADTNKIIDRIVQVEGEEFEFAEDIGVFQGM